MINYGILSKRNSSILFYKKIVHYNALEILWGAAILGNLIYFRYQKPFGEASDTAEDPLIWWKETFIENRYLV